MYLYKINLLNKNLNVFPQTRNVKYKIKHLIKYFLSNLDVEKAMSIHDLSIFFSVLIATLTLRKRQQNIEDLNFTNYHLSFKTELTLIKDRFPELIEVFIKTESIIGDELLTNTFEKLKDALDEDDDDIDDMISWSYQFLKQDAEKSAFKKIGKNQAKIEDADLLFTTQFFTDRYMVKYLVDASLSEFSASNIDQVVLIDPACGGGNFLNYAFEKLFHLYQKLNLAWSEQKIVDIILNQAIIGYDLDTKLSKIAALSLFVKACNYAIPSKTIHIRIYGGIENDKLGFLNNNIASNTIHKTTFKKRLEKIEKEQKIKVFVTNPPFMGKRDMDISLKNYLLAHYPESKADLCVSFLQRLIGMMNKGDILGVVSQNNWMYLSSLKDFRKLFLASQTLKKCIDLGSNAFEDINGEKTNVALCIIGHSATKQALFFDLKSKKITAKKTLITQKNIGTELTFGVNQNQFLKNKYLEFNYQLAHGFRGIQNLQLYAEFAKPMQGTSTGNNAEFVKYAWEVNGSPDWKLVSKGGGFSKWAGLNYYKVHWGKNAETIKANKGSALRNIDKIPNTQLVYSDTGTLGLNVRMLKKHQVFIASGPGIQVLEGNKYAHLAFLNSKIATFLLKLINPKFTISAGYISRIPVAPHILDSTFIAEKSKHCLQLKEKYLQGKLPNFEFEHIDYSKIKNLNTFIEQSILKDLKNDYQRLLLESEIELDIQKQYNFNSKELSAIKRTVGESSFLITNNNFQLSVKELDILIAKNLDINCLCKGKALKGYFAGSESLFENLCCKSDVHPKTILNVIEKNIGSLEKVKAKYYDDFLHKLILYELGIKHISIYPSHSVNIKDLTRKIATNYAFLANNTALEYQIIAILNTHHKKSFFNKALITIADKSLIVGQVQHG